MTKKVIVLGADNGYQDKVETTIKSICAHNHNLKFYVFNDDISTEWFQLMSKRLELLSSEIVNVKITNHSLRDYNLPLSHLSYAAFFRYFIPQFVKEDKALYLDSDIIVRTNIDELFLEDITDYPLAAVADALVPSTFNSGVMLINVALWKQENATERLLELTNEFHTNTFGDQGILNKLFENRWYSLDSSYNFMVGMDTVARNYQIDSWYIDSLKLEDSAKIIHFTGDKPWYQVNLNRFREDWWFYYSLEWSDIVMRKADFKKGLNSLIEASLYHTAIFTNACNIEHLEYLIRELPQVHFSILAHTGFASEIVDLQRYLNVQILPSFNPMNFKKVLEKIDFYLDINHENEIANIIEEVYQIGKPILSFDNTCHNVEKASFICESKRPEKMVDEIKKLLKFY